MKSRKDVERRCAAMRAAKACKRLESSEPIRGEAWRPPKLRRIIVVIDLDSGRPMIRMAQLWRSNRIDTFNVRTPRGESRRPVGFSRVLASVRKGMPRASIRA